MDRIAKPWPTNGSTICFVHLLPFTRTCLVRGLGCHRAAARASGAVARANSSSRANSRPRIWHEIWVRQNAVRENIFKARNYVQLEREMYVAGSNFMTAVRTSVRLPAPFMAPSTLGSVSCPCSLLGSMPAQNVKGSSIY